MFTTPAQSYFVRALILVLSFATTLSFAQQPAGKPSDKPKPASSDTHQRDVHPPDVLSPDNPDILRQMNSALEELAARVSPAVVQIQTSGYGPLSEGDGDRGRTALIVRQRAVGSGVIVDANGYIMTNAHVVERAQRIRVALPMPMGDSAGQVPVGKRRILEAKVLGQHKESDLALLKIDETDLPTLPLLSQQRPHVGQLVFAIGSPEGLQNSVTM